MAFLLALNGLRVSEALGADIEDLGMERGHDTLLVRRKGGTTVLGSLAPRTARTVYLAVGDRTATWVSISVQILDTVDFDTPVSHPSALTRSSTLRVEVPVIYAVMITAHRA